MTLFWALFHFSINNSFFPCIGCLSSQDLALQNLWRDRKPGEQDLKQPEWKEVYAWCTQFPLGRMWGCGILLEFNLFPTQRLFVLLHLLPPCIANWLAWFTIIRPTLLPTQDWVHSILRPYPLIENYFEAMHHVTCTIMFKLAPLLSTHERIEMGSLSFSCGNSGHWQLTNIVKLNHSCMD